MKLFSLMLWGLLGVTFSTRVVDAWAKGSPWLALLFLLCAVAAFVRLWQAWRKPGEGKGGPG